MVRDHQHRGRPASCGGATRGGEFRRAELRNFSERRHWVARAIPALRRAGITRLYHVGDFGIWPGDQSFIKTVEYWAELAGLEIWVTPGNHDDYDQIDACIANATKTPPKYTPHIRLLPRGFRWEQGGRTFVSLGGADSVDRDEREVGKTWWPQERISEHDVATVVAGGPADIMITHDAPFQGALSLLDEDRIGRVGVSAARVHVAVTKVRPRVHVHGHWHRAARIKGPGNSQVISLAAEFERGNIGVLNLGTLSWKWLDDGKLAPWTGPPMRDA